MVRSGSSFALPQVRGECVRVRAEAFRIGLQHAHCGGAGGDAPFLANGQVFYRIHGLDGNAYRFSNQENPITYRDSGLGNASGNRAPLFQTTFSK